MKKARGELEQLFEEEGMLEEVRALAQKKILADEFRAAMKARNMTPAKMARRMGTSRPTVYRLLDPSDPGATLDTLTRASEVLDLQISLVPRAAPARRATRRRPTKKVA